MTTALALPGWGTSPDRLGPLCEGLADVGIDARPWPYEPRGSIASIGGLLAREVHRLRALGEDVHVVGHSLGGLVAASAVLDHDAPATSVTTINSPWRGTWAAFTAHPDDPLGRELRWRADALGALRDGLATHLEQDAGPRWSILAVAGDLAAPPSTAMRVPEGDRLEKVLVGTHGHSVSLLHPKVIDAVVAQLTAPVA